VSDFLFRGYRAGDLDAMYALDIVCFEEPFRFSRREMGSYAEARGAKVVIAELDGVLAGFCIAHVEAAKRERVGYVVTLDVAPQFRRGGLATGLMQRVESEAHIAGCTEMRLHVFTGNEAAIRFYERTRYEFGKRDEGFYGVGVDALVYRKALGRAIL
jgi:ribosomal-protein-alanine N-acetyltransferase